MPLFLFAVAAVLGISAIRGTLTTKGNQPGLLDLLKGDFVGQNNFLIWVAAIAGIGTLGYIKQIRPVVNAFLGLIVLVLFLSHKGFFAQFVSAAKSTQNVSVTPSQPIQLQPFQPVDLSPSVSLPALSTALPQLIGG